MKYNHILDSTGEVLKLLPVRTRVRHRKHKHLVGEIIHYEWYRYGVVSPMPYCVHWEDNSLAAKLLGFMFVYPCRDDLSWVAR